MSKKVFQKNVVTSVVHLHKVRHKYHPLMLYDYHVCI